MKHKTLFRLMLKAVGVYIFSQGAMYTITQVGEVIRSLLAPSATPAMFFQLSWLIAGVFGMALGLYLFFGGRWVADKAIPGNRPYCHECGYDLSGTRDSRCPECDTPFRPADVAPPGSAGMPVAHTPGGSAREE